MLQANWQLVGLFIGAQVTASLLMINQEITNYYLQSKHQLELGVKTQLRAGDKTIRVACFVKNLGVYFNTCLPMERLVDTMPSACRYHIRSIGYIRQPVKTMNPGLVKHRLV